MRYDTGLTLYFSLPFYPVDKKNCFFHGHTALQLENTVYQVYNPLMLKSNFLISVMPANVWLNEAGVYWVNNDPSAAAYKWVNLYGKAELQRTVVYSLTLNDVPQVRLNKYFSFFAQTEERYKLGEMKFSLLSDNCTGYLFPVFKNEGLMNKGLLNFLPAVFFKKALYGAVKKKR
ncbi:MAG TPA: hypothetical protein VKS21_04125, partial [Spirochaetota bacterium]|nr:hypothetical protein [Spirochaetota bacterium]